jgi:hypothetical protein
MSWWTRESLSIVNQTASGKKNRLNLHIASFQSH